MNKRPKPLYETKDNIVYYKFKKLNVKKATSYFILIYIVSCLVLRGILD